MPPDQRTEYNKYIHVFKQAGLKSLTLSKHGLLFILIRQPKKYTFAGKKICKEKLIPGICTGSSLIKKEIIKIHQKKHWFNRCSNTMSGNAIGLGTAMLSTKVVEHFVEVREMSNLWGLLASRPVVSGTTYEILSFFAEFSIALIVFTLAEHFYEEYRQHKRKQTNVNESGDEVQVES